MTKKNEGTIDMNFIRGMKYLTQAMSVIVGAFALSASWWAILPLSLMFLLVGTAFSDLMTQAELVAGLEQKAITKTPRSLTAAQAAAVKLDEEDRDTAIDSLIEKYTEGKISKKVLDNRSARVLKASTLGELEKALRI